MDDEEEDMSRPILQLWRTPFGEVEYGNQTTQMAAGQAITAVTVAVPMLQSHNNNNGISVNALPCSLHWQPRIPFHGNNGLRAPFSAQFQPMEDRGQNEEEEEEEEDNSLAERNEEQAGVSVEAQIGRKLRQIGDKFNQDHVDLFMRHQRQNLPVWMRLTIAMLGFLFPREALIPRLRGQQR